MRRTWLLAATLALASCSTAEVPVVEVLRASCDPGVGPCRVELGDGHAITLTLSPRPVPQLTPFDTAVQFTTRTGDVQQPKITFAGPSMGIGAVTASLHAVGETYAARTLLPLCTAKKMEWEATVEAELDGSLQRATFIFTTYKVTDGAAAPSTTNEVLPIEARPPISGVVQTATGPLDLVSLRGKVALVYFGYTFCPDICPTSLALTAAALKQLTPEERAQVAVVFISVDPGRDTPAHLAEYAHFFDAQIVGSTATASEIAALAAQFQVLYSVNAPEPGQAADAYVVDHSAFTTLVDRRGRQVAQLPHGTAPAVLVEQFRSQLAHKDTP